MPKVGNKHFSYTPAGRAAAKRERARRQKPAMPKRRMKRGKGRS